MHLAGAQIDDASRGVEQPGIEVPLIDRCRQPVIFRGHMARCASPTNGATGSGCSAPVRGSSAAACSSRSRANPSRTNRVVRRLGNEMTSYRAQELIALGGRAVLVLFAFVSP